MQRYTYAAPPICQRTPTGNSELIIKPNVNPEIGSLGMSFGHFPCQKSLVSLFITKREQRNPYKYKLASSIIPLLFMNIGYMYTFYHDLNRGPGSRNVFNCNRQKYTQDKITILIIFFIFGNEY